MANFVMVKCACGNNQPVFSHAKMEIKCIVCGKALAKPMGGKAKIFGEIVKVLE
ncbi:MAG: 30S ribosomal protein S27e [Candidatus Asgardarchaeia archaeon]